MRAIVHFCIATVASIFLLLLQPALVLSLLEQASGRVHVRLSFQVVMLSTAAYLRQIGCSMHRQVSAMPSDGVRKSNRRKADKWSRKMIFECQMCHTEHCKIQRGKTKESLFVKHVPPPMCRKRALHPEKESNVETVFKDSILYRNGDLYITVQDSVVSPSD